MLGCSSPMVTQLEASTKTPGLKLAERIAQLSICETADWMRPATCSNCRKSLSDLTLRICDEPVCPHLAQQLEAAE